MEVFTGNNQKDPQMTLEISPCDNSSQELSPSMILLVDDDPDIRSLTRTFLEHEGYSVFSSGDAERAVQIFRSVPQIDLLVTDLHMPGRTGLELGRELKAARSELPVLLISGALGRKSARHSCLGMGGVFWRSRFGCRSFSQRYIGFWLRWRPGGGARRSRGFLRMGC